MAKVGRVLVDKQIKNSVRHEIYFVEKNRKVSKQELEGWSEKGPLDTVVFYISSAGQNTPIPQNQTIKLGYEKKVFSVS